MPQLVCIPRWAQKDLAGTLDIQRDIKAMLNLRVHPQPLDIIDEPNLRTYMLAPRDDNDEVSWTRTAIAPSSWFLKVLQIMVAHEGLLL